MIPLPRFIWLLITVGLGQLSAGLHITSVYVPSVVFSGSSVNLSCHYRSQGDSLYSLSWWKDDQLFYKYIPALVPPYKIYPVPGIEVDKYSSDLREVVLSNVDHRASGFLRCEVLSEQSFMKEYKGANMTVIARPQRSPRITGKRPSGYRVGDLLVVNCTSAPSHPPATLHWLINGRSTSTETIIKYPGEVDSQGLVSSCSELQMFLQPSHFIKGALVIGCSASILNLKGQLTEKIIMDSDFPVEAPKSQFSESRSSALTIKGAEHSVLLVLLMLSWRQSIT